MNYLKIDVERFEVGNFNVLSNILQIRLDYLYQLCYAFGSPDNKNLLLYHNLWHCDGQDNDPISHVLGHLRELMFPDDNYDGCPITITYSAVNQVSSPYESHIVVLIDDIYVNDDLLKPIWPQIDRVLNQFERFISHYMSPEYKYCKK